MVSSVANPTLASPQAALGRAASDDTTSGKISPAPRREIAITAKFGPDPETGSPLQIITGDDVAAAETNDLQRLAEANLNRSSPQTAFQAQSIRSDEEFAREADSSEAAKAVQQSLSASQFSFTETGDTGSQRGSTVDFLA